MVRWDVGDYLIILYKIITFAFIWLLKDTHVSVSIVDLRTKMEENDNEFGASEEKKGEVCKSVLHNSMILLKGLMV